MDYDSRIAFYHGKLSREDAEKLLKESNDGDGTFLVRDSNSSSGDYVLSVLSNDEVIHFQIRKHQNDAFFSIDEQTISHGLETLIEYYQTSDRGLNVTLKNPIPKDLPPPETRLHGRTNLLHRATRQGDIKVVTAVLKAVNCNLEARNQEGQTAVHLACKVNRNDILEMLIASKANVNCRDSEGNTPLHYACHRNSPSTIRILVEKGDANVQMRNSKTGWVPLHDAASRGYIDCVEALLSLNAPLRPRTNFNEIPADLARRNGHNECFDLLQHFTAPTPRTRKSDWYHGTLGRTQAIETLKNFIGNPDGSFLVRYSGHSGYVLTMLYLEQPYNFQIHMQDHYYYIDDGPYVDSLEHLIDYYMTMADGLPIKLQNPVPPTPGPPLPNTPHPSLSSTLPRPTRNAPRKSSMLDASDMKNLSIHNTATLPLSFKPKTIPLVPLETPPAENFESVEEKNNKTDESIPRDNIILRDVIGEGEFGSVYRAILQTREGFEEEVAVKTLRQDIAESSRDEFLREAAVMMKLNHSCIVKFIGICTEPPNLLMVQELVTLGSVLCYLLKKPHEVNPNYELKIWANQIARGMQYLEEQRFVHRDLAARNILLATKFQAKITDFGLSRTLTSDREYYRATSGGRWPIKWYAPESYNFGTFSSASDVWSFGVTLWEMYSYGDQPYGALKGSEVIDLVDRGERLPQPKRCPAEIYEIMLQCWEYNSRNRPTFSELVQKFTFSEYVNVTESLNISN
ncbi:tyrosine-protein kinase Shark-like [Planococcus citri]|uniref:tyrosine-protein kinase Shark-like n=1 Tax=Planococcus citri TaxID=170843 RepID=UPI0031F9BF6F